MMPETGLHHDLKRSLVEKEAQEHLFSFLPNQLLPAR